MVEKWCMFFKYADEMTEDDLQKLIEAGDVVIKDAYVALDRFNWSEQELLAYEQELKRVLDNAAVEEAKLDAAEAKGIEKGREEGKKAEKIEIAKLMISKNKPIEEIIELTGLTESEIKSLKI